MQNLPPLMYPVAIILALLTLLTFGSILTKIHQIFFSSEDKTNPQKRLGKQERYPFLILLLILGILYFAYMCLYYVVDMVQTGQWCSERYGGLSSCTFRDVTPITFWFLATIVYLVFLCLNLIAVFGFLPSLKKMLSKK